MQICISVNLCYLYTRIYNLFFKYIYIQWQKIDTIAVISFLKVWKNLLHHLLSIIAKLPQKIRIESIQTSRYNYQFTENLGVSGTVK